jgi:leader peptidase (prepilin peptidase)/N-methyltransferase
MIIAIPLVKQANHFLDTHAAPRLTRLQIYTVTITFTMAGTSLLLASFLPEVSNAGVFKCLILLAWGIPMVLLDLSKCWLPLCFTNGFWLSGILFTFLPGNSLNGWEALFGSAGMFGLLYTLHFFACRLFGDDAFGLGDIHLISALCAWFPWQLASLLSGCGFVLFIAGALVTKRHSQPYAPWLFAFIAGLATFFPKLTLTDVF